MHDRHAEPRTVVGHRRVVAASRDAHSCRHRDSHPEASVDTAAWLPTAFRTELEVTLSAGASAVGINVAATLLQSAGSVIRRFLGDRHVVRVILAQTGRGDLDELGVGAQGLD